MTTFDIFISANRLKKKDVAEYLGIAASNISQYCSGSKIPPATLERLRARTDWDTSMFGVQSAETNAPKKSSPAALEAMAEEMAALRQIVENQTVQIAMMKTMLDAFMEQGTRE